MPTLHLRGALALVAMLGLMPQGVVSQATPPGSPMVAATAECTIPSRPPAELWALAETGFRLAAQPRGEQVEQEATADGTPPVAEPSSPEPTSETASSGMTPVVDGIPAEAETVAAVEDTMLQFAACTNAGDFFALLSVLDDESASRFLGFAVLSYAQVSTGSFDEPPAELDPAVLDGFLAARAIESPPARDQRISTVEVREVVQLADRSIVATVAFDFEARGAGIETVLLKEEDGHYVIDYGGGSATDGAATPESSARAE